MDMNRPVFVRQLTQVTLKPRGFTLLELLVALTIVAIVSAVAIPIYTTFSERAYRTEAQSDLLTCAQALERWSAVWFTYLGAADENNDGPSDGVPSGSDTGAPGNDVCDPISVDQQRYNVTMTATATTFWLTATPIVNGVMDGDGAFRINETGLRQWDKNNSGDYGAGENDWDED